MTEQPPPSAEPTREDMERAAEFLDEWFGLGGWPPVYRLDALLNTYAERVCEQRVSAETERLWARIEAEAAALPCPDHYSAEVARTILRRAIRAPAERPAPEGPQQEDLPRRIGVWQPTQETDRPGCGDHRLPCDVWVRHIKYGKGVRLQTLADAAARWLAAAQAAERPHPVPIYGPDAVGSGPSLHPAPSDEMPPNRACLGADCTGRCDPELRCRQNKNRRSVPSDLASTGEQPDDKEEDLGKESV